MQKPQKANIQYYIFLLKNVNLLKWFLEPD
jgi:hypothetical protein